MKRISAILAALLFLAIMSPLTAISASDGESYDAGLLALKSGDSQKAVTLLSKAIEARPRDFRYYNDRGVAYRMMGDLEKAAADYSKAIELKPDYTNALNNRGTVHLQQGLFDNAIQDFLEALKHGGLESKIYTNLGAAYAGKGDYRAAIKHFDAAISLRPMDYRSFILMGETLEKMGDKDRALKMYQLGVGFVPDSALANRLEKKVAALEKSLLIAQQTGGKAAGTKPPATAHPEPEKVASGQTAKPDAGPTRRIILAKPIPPSTPAAPKYSAPAPEAGVETPEGLEQRARARVMEKMAPISAEILRQGLEFLGKNDSTKALVRFEDTLQLEKRKKNDLGVAWSSFEIGRVYSRLGDQVKAASYLDAAQKIFRKLKASDETVLTLFELAGSKAKAGQKDQAAGLYSAAAHLAGSAGHHGLSRLIEEIAAGKPYQAPKPAFASARQPGAEQQTASGRVAQPERMAAPRPDLQKTAPLSQIPPAQVNQGVVVRNNEPKGKEPAKPAGVTGQPGQTAQIGRAPIAGPQPQASLKQVPALPAPPQKSTVSAQVSRMADKKAELERLAALSKAKPNQGKPVLAEKKVEAAERLSRVGTPARPSLEATRRRPGLKEPSLETQIKEDLATLKRLRGSNDQVNMVDVLERLAEHYIRRKEYRKASYSLTASLAFQDKLGLSRNRQKALHQSGILKEKLGDPAGALEDITRAMALSDVRTTAKAMKDLETRSKKLAATMGVDAATILASFQSLWRARAAGDEQTETEALYQIGKMYDRAEKPAEALNFYERSSASMLVDKARMHGKMGNARLAQDAYDRALETFRKLDYSRYVSLLKKIRSPRVFSRQ